MSTYLEMSTKKKKKKCVFKAGLELEVRHKFCGLQGTTQNMLPYNQTLPKHRVYNEPESSDQADAPENHPPRSPPFPESCVSGVWHQLLWLAAENEGFARGHKWANKLTSREHTHTHPPVKRSIFKECLLRAVSDRIQ